MLPLLLGTLTLAFSGEPCESPTTIEDTRGAVARSHARFAAGDLPGFQLAVADVRARSACLGEAMSPQDAADLHLVAALGAFADRDVDAAAAHGCVLRALGSGEGIPESIVPAGHPLRWTLAQAECPTGELVPVAVPGDGVLRVDGAPAAGVPGDPSWRPYHLQVVRGGAALFSQSVPLGGPLPELRIETASGSDLTVAVVTEQPSGSRARSRQGPLVVGLAVGGGAVAVAGVAMWVQAHVAHKQRYFSAEYRPDELTSIWYAHGRPQRDAGVVLTGVGALAAGAGVLVVVSPGGVGVAGTF